MNNFEALDVLLIGGLIWYRNAKKWNNRWRRRLFIKNIKENDDYIFQYITAVPLNIINIGLEDISNVL